MILSFGASGFNYSRWRGDYYPDDMPEEWCFTYYANEFDSVFLAKESTDDLEQFIDDLDDSFYLLLEDVPEVRDKSKSMDVSEPLNIGYCLFDEEGRESFQKFQLDFGKVNFLNKTIENACVIRASSSEVVTNSDLKSLIEYLVENFQSVSQVFVFFEGAASTASTIKLAQMISDLMLKSD